MIKLLKYSLIIGATLLSLGTSAHAQEASLQQKINILNKFGYGVTDKSLKEFEGLSTQEWFNRQLQSPPYYNDSAIESKYKFITDNTEFYKKYKSLYLADKNQKMDKEYLYGDNGLIYNNLKRRIDYAFHSENRIKEMMQWFWFNHFNIGVYSSATSVLFLNDFENRIRKNSMGNFRDLLRSVITSPAMLGYLNNVDNQVSKNEVKLNENYARELLELHTLGVNAGYSQKDVENVTKTLTGFSAAFPRLCYGCDLAKINTYDDYIKSYFKGDRGKAEHYVDGYFVFDGYYHLYSPKTVLGVTIKSEPGKGFSELDQLIDILMKQPEMAKFISKKMAIYFLHDNPSEMLVQNMANTFTKTNGNISSVLNTLFQSNEFQQYLNKKDKFKDVFTYIISSLKTSFEHDRFDDELLLNTAKLLNSIEADPYFKDTPNGFSVYGKDWINSGRLQQYIAITHNMLKLNNISAKRKQEYSVNFKLIQQINPKIKTKDDLFQFLISEQWLKR